MELLRNDASREQVQLAVVEQQTVVTKFVSLLLKEEDRQATEKKKDNPIVVTDASCKP